MASQTDLERVAYGAALGLTDAQIATKTLGELRAAFVAGNFGSSGSSLREIDVAERTTNFDVQSVGTTSTEIEGLTVIVPPQTKPYKLELDLLAAWNTGTAAAAAQQLWFLQVQEFWYVGTVLTWAARINTGIEALQVSAAAKTIQKPIRAAIRMEPHTDTKRFRTMIAMSAASPAGWTSGQILMNIGLGAVGVGSSQLGYQPGILSAVSL